MAEAWPQRGAGLVFQMRRSGCDQFSVTQFVDDLVRHAEHVKVDDLTPGITGDYVNHSSQERIVVISGNDHRTRLDTFRLLSLVKKRPHVTTRIELMHIGGKRDLGHHSVLT